MDLKKRLKWMYIQNLRCLQMLKWWHVNIKVVVIKMKGEGD